MKLNISGKITQYFITSQLTVLLMAATAILGVFALVLVMGGFYVVGKSNASGLVAASARSAGSVAAAAAPVAASAGDKLLEAMKDELFHLEIDRQQGKVTQAEYEKTKAALDETIKRALARAKA